MLPVIFDANRKAHEFQLLGGQTVVVRVKSPSTS